MQVIRPEQVVFVCDTCRKVLQTGSNRFVRANEVLKEKKWKIYNRSNVFQHACEDCVMDWAIEAEARKAWEKVTRPGYMGKKRFGSGTRK